MMNLALYYHDLSPYAIGPIRWYGLSYLVGFFIAWLWIRRVLRVGRCDLDHRKAGDLVVTLALGIVIGGRLGYVLFYEPALLWTFSKEIPFWHLLALNKGGMSFHGGVIGGALTCWWLARKYQQPVPFVWDLMAFAAPLGLFFGRIANFVNGELWGRAVSRDFPLAVIFPGDPQMLPRHPSQLYEAATEGLLLFLVMLWFYRKPRKPGFVGAVFLIGYAIARICCEQFRQPDEQVGFEPFGTTRGQWLSAAMIAGAAVLLWFLHRSRREPMGGWGGKVKSEK
ncbi:MAG: prolipoprotein diacylglyceryl transferase [Phycisphaeraceae bacterium]|nr:prolipoprotein diacylglyceryl transferase [Phycisphaeraceae bacterium]